MPQNIPITADVYVNTQPAAQQLKAFSDKNLRNIRLGLGVDTSGLKRGSAALGQIRNDADQFTKSMAAANARVLAFGTAVGVIEAMRRSFVALVKTTVDVEEALAKISIVAGDDLAKAGVSIGQLGKSLFNIARDTGQSFETVNQAALEFQRQGIGVQESLKRTRDAMIAVRISGVGVGDAVNGLTSILNAFKKSGIDSTTVLNKLVALDNSSAASFPDLIQGLQRAASISQLAGNNFDQTAASIATLQEITARGGPIIGNALKSIDTRLYGEKSLEFLESFRGGIIKIKDDAGQLLPSIEIIRNLSGALTGLPKEEQLGALTKLAGLYQVNSIAALVESFKAVNGETTLYDKNLATLSGTTNEAVAANKKLSEILAAQFNTINVNIGEFLNKLGEIGIKNPFSNVLNFLIKIQGSLQNILEGSGPLDKLVQIGVKFAGGALFSTSVVTGGAFVLVKIIKDFLSFASTAFKVFTGINGKLSEENSILSQVGSKLKAGIDSVNSISNAEQRRLSLTKLTSAEYAKQLALTNAIGSSLGSKTVATTPKFIFGDSVSDFSSRKTQDTVAKPSLVNNASAAVTAATLAKIPSPTNYAPPSGFNVSGGLRNKSGQFVDQTALNTSIRLMSNQWISVGKSGLELSNLIRKEIGNFNLDKESFRKAARAANEYANGLIKARADLAKNLPRPSFLNQPSFLQKQPDLATSNLLAFQRSSNPSKLPTDLFNVEAGRRASANIAERERRPGIGAFGYGGNQYQVAPLSAAAQRIPASTGGFDPEKLKNAAFNAVLLSAAAEGLASTFRGVNPTLDRFADLLSKSTFALTGIIALNQLGGVNLGGLLSKGAGGGLSKILGGGGAVAGIFAPLIAAGKGFLRVVPVIGQVALGLAILNEAVRAFTGNSALEQLDIAFGGLTDGATKAKDRFNEIAKELFDSQGKYTARSFSDRQSSLSNTRSEATQRIIAQKQGIKIDGKNPQEIATESFRKLLFDSVANIKIGGSKSDLSGAGGIGGGIRDAVVGDLSSSAQEYLKTTLADVTSGTLEDLRSNASAIGITNIGSQSVSSASVEQLQTAIAKAFTEQFIKAYSSKYSKDEFGKNTDFNKLILDQSGQQRLAGFALNFINKGKSNPVEKPSFAGLTKEISPELKKQYLEYQRDFELLLLDQAANSIESQIKNLDIKSQDGTLTKSAQKAIEDTRFSLQQKALGIDTQKESTKARFAPQIIDAEVAAGKKTTEEAAFELGRVGKEASNAYEAIRQKRLADIKAKEAQDRTTASLEKLGKVTGAAQAALSSIAVSRARSNQRVSALESAANNPAIDTFSRENLQRQANQVRIDDLRTNGLNDIREQARIARTEAQGLPADQRTQRLNEINKDSQQKSIDLETSISEIVSATNQIGVFASASVELTNSLIEFERSLPSSRAQNDFNTLQSTDASGLAGGLISKQVFGAAEGKTGQELVSFLADQNALLNEQFKIRTATNATEKLELETQLALTKELLDIKTQALDPLEKQQKIEDAINKNLALRRSFGFGVSQAQAGIQSDIQNFSSSFGKTATEGFRDSLVGAMQAAVSKTDDLKSALLNVALTFANKLRDAAFENLANLIVNSGSKSGGSTGGIISSVIGGIGNYFTGGQKKAAGGMISGGSGTKDDVPTLLMGGEYVIPKGVVNQYGVGFFEGLRNGSVGKMAQGGFFAPGVMGQGTITGKNDLLDFATQTATSGSKDRISNLGNGAAIAALEPESLRLSNFARFGDSPIIQATQDAKDQAFGLYIDQINNEKEYQKFLDDQAKAKKEAKKQLWTSIAIAAIGSAVSYGASSYGASSAAKKSTTAKSSGNTQRYYDTAGSLVQAAGSSIPAQQSVPSSAIKTSSDGFYNPYPVSNSLPQSIAPVQGFYTNPLLPKINVNGQYRNAGGYVGGNGDSVPTNLSNKEFVLNSSAAQKIGDKNLYALNNGGTPSSGGGSDEKIIAKLDELIQKTIGASNVTVNVSMDSSGKDTSSSNQSSGEDNQKDSRGLTQKLKNAVVGILREEQRPGGVLAKQR